MYMHICMYIYAHIYTYVIWCVYLRIIRLECSPRSTCKFVIDLKVSVVCGPCSLAPVQTPPRWHVVVVGAVAVAVAGQVPIVTPIRRVLPLLPNQAASRTIIYVYIYIYMNMYIICRNAAALFGATRLDIILTWAAVNVWALTNILGRSMGRAHGRTQAAGQPKLVMSYAAMGPPREFLGNDAWFTHSPVVLPAIC